MPRYLNGYVNLQCDTTIKYYFTIKNNLKIDIAPWKNLCNWTQGNVYYIIKKQSRIVGN